MVPRETYLDRPADLAEAATRAAVELSNAGRHREAIAIFEQQLAQRPDAPDLLSDLGNAYLAAGDADRALSVLQLALEVDPSNAQAHVNLGAAWHALGEYDRAIGDYTAAMTLAPEWSAPLFNIGLAERAKGDWFGARLHMLRAAALDPADPELAEAAASVVPQGISEHLLPVGFSPEQYSFSGKISNFGVPGLLEFLKNNRSTGIVVIVRSGGGAALWMLDGDLVAGGMPGEGPALEGLSPAQIVAAQVSAVLRHTFTWTEGQFYFSDYPLHGADEQALRDVAVDTRMAILEAARMLDEGSRAELDGELSF